MPKNTGPAMSCRPAADTSVGPAICVAALGNRSSGTPVHLAGDTLQPCQQSPLESAEWTAATRWPGAASRRAVPNVCAWYPRLPARRPPRLRGGPRSASTCRTQSQPPAGFAGDAATPAARRSRSTYPRSHPLQAALRAYFAEMNANSIRHVHAGVVSWPTRTGVPGDRASRRQAAAVGFEQDVIRRVRVTSLAQARMSR